MMRTYDATVRDSAGSTYVVPSLREPVAFHLFFDGVYERETLRFLFSRLGPGSIFVDVGANIGAMTVPVARQVGPNGRVLAIEASPRVFRYLEHNIAANGIANVRLKCCAASDAQTPALPFFEAPPECFGAGSVGPQSNALPRAVPAVPLDCILESENISRVDVLKVDVEGFESAVFRGAARLLNGPAPPIVVFEFGDWAEARTPNAKVGDAQRLLREYGYTLWLLDDFGRRNSRPLERVLVEGGAMLVAEKPAYQIPPIRSIPSAVRTCHTR
jgi:FkbM family methyltransferase